MRPSPIFVSGIVDRQSVAGGAVMQVSWRYGHNYNDRPALLRLIL